MISISGPKREVLHAIVTIAFDTKTGHVRGTFVDGYYGTQDSTGIDSRRRRFIAELQGRLGNTIVLDSIQVPLDDLKGSYIERVDAKTRKPILKVHKL
jgi:hypothetical protein